MSASNPAGTALGPADILELLPQHEPFRFVDEILEVDEDHIVATYRYQPEADFYRVIMIIFL